MNVAEQHIADRPIVGVFSEKARPPVRPKFDSLLSLDLLKLRGGMMLRIAHWFHPIAV